MNSLRPRHRDYMRRHLKQILFGGLAFDEKVGSTTVCICLNVETVSEANLFLDWRIASEFQQNLDNSEIGSVFS